MPRAVSTRPLCALVVVTTSMAFGMEVKVISRCANMPASSLVVRMHTASIRRCVLRRMH